MCKEEILNEYFLVETEITNDMKGWRVIGVLSVPFSSYFSPIVELKTDEECWLCDFRIRFYSCGLVLASPEYIIDEDETIMEATEKLWGEVYTMWYCRQDALNATKVNVLDYTKAYPYVGDTVSTSTTTNWEYTDSTTANYLCDSINNAISNAKYAYSTASTTLGLNSI